MLQGFWQILAEAGIIRYYALPSVGDDLELRDIENDWEEREYFCTLTGPIPSNAPAGQFM